MMGDESWQGAGPSVGGIIGARMWRGAWAEVAIDRLHTKRDFSTDVHWRDRTLLFTGGMSYRFTGSRVQPFIEGALGAARTHSTRIFPTWAPDSTGRIARGPDQVDTSRATNLVWGFGAGLRMPAGRAFSISPELKCFVVPDSSNPRSVWQGSIRLSYGWRGGGVPPVEKKRTPKVNGRPAPTAIPQPLARSFQELSDRLAPGDLVHVVDEAGREAKGIVSALSPSSLVLLVDGTPRELPEESVARIDRRGDRLRDGMLRGLIIGAITPAAIIFSLCQDGCSQSSDRAAAISWSLSFGLIGAGAGAAAGAGVDALRIGRTTVYSAPAASKSARLAVLPEMSGGRKAVHVALRF